VNEAVQFLVDRGFLRQIESDSKTYYKTTPEGREIAKELLTNIDRLLGRLPKPRFFTFDLAKWLESHDLRQAMIMVQCMWR